MKPSVPASLVLLGSLILPAAAQDGRAPGLSLPPLDVARLGQLLPQASQSVAVMERRPTLSTGQLEQRVREVGGDLAALDRVLASARRGERAPYTQDLKVTHEEYSRFVVFQNVLVEVQRLRLSVSRTSSRLTFGVTPELPSFRPPGLSELKLPPVGQILSGLSLNLKTGELRTPEGFTARPVPLPPGTSSGPDGRVGGYQWKLLGSDAARRSGIHGTLNLIELRSGDALLNYSRTSMVRGEMNGGEVTLRYRPAGRELR